MGFKFKRENITKLNPNIAIVAASFALHLMTPIKRCAHSFCLRVLLRNWVEIDHWFEAKILIGKRKGQED